MSINLSPGDRVVAVVRHEDKFLVFSERGYIFELLYTDRYNYEVRYVS